MKAEEAEEGGGLILEGYLLGRVDVFLRKLFQSCVCPSLTSQFLHFFICNTDILTRPNLLNFGKNKFKFHKVPGGKKSQT